MIVNCENCGTRYLLPAHAIGADGRTVRCTRCAHEWFQEPESDDPSDFREPEDIEPIPESVRPLPEGSEVPVHYSGADEDIPAAAPSALQGIAAGIAAGFVIIVLFTGLLLALSGPVTKIFSPAAGLYELLGIQIAVPGEGLIFDQVSARSAPGEQGLQILTIEGKLINLQSRPVSVPYIQAALRDETGTVIDGWQIDPPVAELAGESETVFTTFYPEIPDDVETVQLRLYWPQGAGP